MKKIKLPIFIFTTIALIGAGFFYLTQPKTITKELSPKIISEQKALNDFNTIPLQDVTETKDNFTVTDDGTLGMKIEYKDKKANDDQKAKNEEEQFKLTFNKDLNKGIDVKLDKERTISIKNLSNEKYNSTAIQEQNREDVSLSPPGEGRGEGALNKITSIKEKLTSLFKTNQTKAEQKDKYVKYQSENKRKEIYYAYQKDHAGGTRKLKNWTIYNKPNTDKNNYNRQIPEQESYKFENAKLSINDKGEVEVRYFGQKEIQNEQAAANVDKDLMARARRFLAKELGEDALKNAKPDFVIPKPYYLDKDGGEHYLTWILNDDKTEISLNFSPQISEYPVALDPTLSFSLRVFSANIVFTGEATGGYLSHSMVAGDFNLDGKTDIAISAHYYNSSTGGVYIFYGGNMSAKNVSAADVILTGESTSNHFGSSLAVADFNSDGKNDLAIGANSYNSDTGRAYIFYNSSIATKNASAADVIITGDAGAGSNFGISLAVGDFNTDGKIDLSVGAMWYNSGVGRAYVFFSNLVTKNASAADVIITGNASSFLGSYSFSGDFNADGKTDLAIYGGGSVYIFYNGNISTKNISAADVVLSCDVSSFGSFSVGDFNGDGKTDIVVGSASHDASTGQVYIFYGPVSTKNASSADVVLTGEKSGTNFGGAIAVGDFNADGKTDLAVGAYGYDNSTGRAFVYYNNSLVTKSVFTPDITIIGGVDASSFGSFLIAGDFNTDGKIDIAAGAKSYSTNTGRVYIFYGSISSSDIAAVSTLDGVYGRMVAGDFNSDGRLDLAVGMGGYNSNTGRVYIFYSSLTVKSIDMADVVLTGETTSNSFGNSLATGDFNNDGKVDLAVSAYQYNSFTGRIYIFYSKLSSKSASLADVVLDGDLAGGYFCLSLAAADFNGDGKTDLASGAQYYGAAGRVSIFYGPLTTKNATSAEVVIDGDVNNRYIGSSLLAHDFNNDSRVDLAVAAVNSSTSTGRVYVFYSNFASKSASSADVVLTGEAINNSFGGVITAGDFNSDGKTDIAVGASYAGASYAGRAYVFYGPLLTENASVADVVLNGENAFSYFGSFMESGDFNSDGKIDLVVSAYSYNSETGRVYVFYNGNINSKNASAADVVLTGALVKGRFGSSLVVGDLNVDGKTDLIIGASAYNSVGRVYIFTSFNNKTNPNTYITGGTTNNYFASSMTSGDFNNDGKKDLAVGAYGYSSNTGRAYIFYAKPNNSKASTTAEADVTIQGEANNNYFGRSMISGDFNSDGKTDLAVGADGYNSNTGRIYVNYNDGSYTTLASTSDLIITGEGSSNYFGSAMVAGDFNTDGRTDIIGGAYGYNSNSGRAYLFYNDGSMSTTASAADLIETGVQSNYLFGKSLTAGDFNNDGRIDFAVGVPAYQFYGSVAVFYNDGSYTVSGYGDLHLLGAFYGSPINGQNFSNSILSEDFNGDGKDDLIVGADTFSTSTGKVVVIYNNGSGLESDFLKHLIITGSSTNDHFGQYLAAHDSNADGKTDLIVGAPGYNGNQGKVYIYHNNANGTYPSDANNADLTITGDASNDYFGSSLLSADTNDDGRDDLVVGSTGVLTNTGRAYFYETRDAFSWDLQPITDTVRVMTNSGAEMKITGQGANNSFASAFASGDFNNDGKPDLAVGAPIYNGYQGKVYLFYNDGSYSNTADAPDAQIYGEPSSGFGSALATADLNSDGKKDLIVGAPYYISNKGRVYIFYNNDYPVSAAEADVKIDGENGLFGGTIMVADLTADGKKNLIIGAYAYNALGRVYVFNNDGSITLVASSADEILTGESSGSYFGRYFVSGDFNADGIQDLVISAYRNNSSMGKVYMYLATSTTVFASTTGEVTTNYYGSSLASGDFNNDSKVDLVVGASNYNSNLGKIYVYLSTSTTVYASTTGENFLDKFGSSLISGDFNSDGKTDLAVGAQNYATGTGAVYILNNDGSYPATAASADMKITGENQGNYYGTTLLSTDFNNDGKTDLLVGAPYFNNNQGRAYMYTFNDRVITGEAILNEFGFSMASGDFNGDGKMDLAVGADKNSTMTGKVYIYYNCINVKNATSADIVLTGEATSNYFGYSLVSGDFNFDGKTDLAVGARMGANNGRVYVFYSSLSTKNASAADVILTGEGNNDRFGISLTSGDINSDGKTDLVVGAHNYTASAGTGRVYIFYSSLSTKNASAADVILAGEDTGSNFGKSLATGDFNSDNEMDIVVGAEGYITRTGRVYVFYGGNIFSKNASAADVIITGETTENQFGRSLSSGDLNSDGKTDLVVGANYYGNWAGSVYIFYSDLASKNASAADVILTGEEGSWDGVGASLLVGDYNSDGKNDLVVGADGSGFYASRAYIFYSNIVSKKASLADVVINGESDGNYFGSSFAAGDFNIDGKTDLAVGAYGYNSYTGRVYMYINETKKAPESAINLNNTVKIKGGTKIQRKVKIR